jgi:hypothetical protein
LRSFFFSDTDIQCYKVPQIVLVNTSHCCYHSV